MKKMIFCSILLVIFVSAMSQQMNIATYNLRYANPGDSGNLWKDRAPVVISLIRFHDFDIFGTQEGLKIQLDDISSALPQYERYGVARDDGKDKGEFAAIYFKKEMFKLLGKGDFWLSETPDQPSMGWDGKCCHRICSWVYLQHIKSGKKFYFFNAHFDHQGIKARVEGSKLVLQKIKQIAGEEPVAFTGDLNGSQTSEWYLNIQNSGILSDSYNQVKYPYVNNASFNSFGAAKNSKEIIDHIFLSKHFTATKWGILTDTYHGKFPSDHFPV
ncbi:MAG: endonuclease/exonuclease/phosphatase family protein, partial [Gemmatimonadaceae bacterium]|nr:endonuclease/exonuclease/phosphatase family protein [Chitinophagaceae bacterium]